MKLSPAAAAQGCCHLRPPNSCASKGLDRTKRRKKDNVNVEKRGAAVCGGDGTLTVGGGFVVLEMVIALLLQSFGGAYSGGKRKLSVGNWWRLLWLVSYGDDKR
ncbi:hypothetical protein GmHk_01G001402 [Glycine max]|nr:hypothetical protein GmHk_01G001402 [Glycine max]